jgi:hypothetical protein
MNLLAPIVLHRAVDIHPVAVLLALMVGGALMGGIGAVVAVPVAAAISVALDEWRNRATAPDTPIQIPPEMALDAPDIQRSHDSPDGGDPQPRAADGPRAEIAPEPGEPAPV